MRHALLAVCLALAAACAPTTVDTVQPNAVAKDVFDGEWYWRTTVADVPYGTSAAFVGAQSDLERITWKVEETWLLGYRAYDLVDDTRSVYAEHGAPVLAYPIEKHFDIRRAYDRTTGEETNVIQENTERPWYQRQYMRVDWSANRAEGEFNLAGVALQVAALQSTDPGEAWAHAFDDSDNDGTIDAMQLYRRVIAAPDSTHIPGYGDVPSCYFYGQANVDCAASEVVLHDSFLKVSDADDYDGLAYDDRWTETFGVFQTQRLHYDRRYGLTEPERVLWANRHDLWAATWERDGGGEVLCKKKGERAPCSSFRLEDGAQPIAIPYLEREVRPIVLHVGPGFDPTLVSTLPRLQEEWNGPFVDTINQLRFWECVDDDGDVESCQRVIDPSIQAFVICPNNPSLPGDPALCSTDHTGPEGRPDGVPDLARVGDLRYHLLHLVDHPQLSSPFGYGPSAADPVGHALPLADGEIGTGAGQIVASNAFIYTSVLDRIATRTADLVALIKGDLDVEAFIDGEQLDGWLEQVRSGEVGSTRGRVEGAPERLTDEAVRDLLDRMDGSTTATLHDAIGTGAPPSDPQAFTAWMDHVRRVLDTDPVASRTALQGRSAWERLVDSPFDEALWNNETIGSWGFDPALIAANPAVLDALSPLDLLDPAQHDERELGALLAGQHALDLDDGSYTDPALIGLARDLADRGLSYEEAYQEIRREIFVAVALHEIGHTVGLRHNFAASTDAWNYHPTYWELRDDGDMGPRHVDPETSAERDGRIREFQYSSVMDYHGSINGDWHGLGRWDRAAVKFAYGQLVEVMADVGLGSTLDGIRDDIAVGYISYFHHSNVYPAPILGAPDGGYLEVHYTDYPQIAGDLQARVDVPLSRMASALGKEGRPPAFDEVMYVEDGIRGYVSGGAPAAPYRFCSDEFAFGAMCARFDEGADPYEIQTWYIQRYWNDYILNNFSRKQYGFGFGDYVGARYSRTFGPLETWQRYYALFHTILGAEFDEGARTYLAASRGMGGWTAGSAEGFRFLTQVITRPEPGLHALESRPDGTVLATPVYDEGPDTINIPVGDGAWFASDWDDDSGYRWFERRSRVGTYWDRMLALQVLTTTSPYAFVGFDTSSDPRTYALGYDTLWRDQLGGFLSALIADEAGAYAPTWDGGGLVYPDPTVGLHGRLPDPDATPVTPGSHWLIRYSAGLFASALLSEGYDHTWLDRARITRAGSGQALTPAAGVTEVRFDDPFSGVTWVAWRYPDDGEELGLGATLLDHAATLKGYCDGTALLPDTDPDDADSLAWQQQRSCESLRALCNDIQLQSEIQAWFQAGGR